MKNPLAIARRIMRGNKMERPLRDLATKVLARSAIVQLLAGSTWALQQLDDAACAVLAQDAVDAVCEIADRLSRPAQDWGGLPPWIDPRSLYDPHYLYHQTPAGIPGTNPNQQRDTP